MAVATRLMGAKVCLLRNFLNSQEAEEERATPLWPHALHSGPSANSLLRPGDEAWGSRPP